jgi:hypothetical protein
MREGRCRFRCESEAKRYFCGVERGVQGGRKEMGGSD